MKVLTFGWEFPPHISGGLGTACFGLTSGLLQQNVDVLFVVPKLFGDEDKSKFRFVDASDVELDTKTPYYYEQIKTLTYIEIGSNIIPYMSPEVFSKKLSKAEKTAFAGEHHQKTKISFSGQYNHDLMKEVAQYGVVAATIARENTFDVIHAHDWLTFPAGMMAKQVTGKPLVAHVHATEFDRSGEHINQDVYNIERMGLHYADAVIAVSGRTKQTLVERYGISANKIEVVHNAILPKTKTVSRKVKSADKEKLITFLGRITFQKGPEYFVEAAKKVLERFPDARFVMAGNGDMLTAIIKRVARLRIGSRFHFTGFLKGEETDRLYGMTDVYVMPSVSEPFGIAPLEAIRSGVPVIISKQSGVSEVLNNAIKVDFWDIDALADAICGLMQYPVLSRTFVREGTREVEELQWKKAALRVNQIYRALTNR
jgi:glycosyltransferase involved in cell wall biosynthesis